MTIPIAIIALLALLAQFSAWMIWRNLMIWQPVAARMSGSDYREAARNIDSMTQPIVLGTLPDEYFNVNHELRQTEVCFRFEDESGQTHTAQLTRLVRRGFGPDASIMLWYDPANPARFTRFGPGSWILMLIASLAALAWLFTGGATALSALSLLGR